MIEVSAGITIFIFNLQLLNYVGNIGVTVFGIICNVSIVIMGLCKGVNQAAQPIISMNHGAGKRERTQEVRGLAMRNSLLICAVPVLVGLIVPNFYTYIFLNPDKDILSLSAEAVRIYFVGFIFLAVNMVYISYFQSVVKNMYSLIICLLRGCIFRHSLRVFAAGVSGCVWYMAGFPGGGTAYHVCGKQNDEKLEFPQTVIQK